VRRARATTATVVLCARCMCPRAVEAPVACAARSGCHKLRTVPRGHFAAPPCRRPAPARAAAQGPARCAPLPRARWRAQRPCSGGRGAPRGEMGTPGAPRSPRSPEQGRSQPLARGARQARRGRGRLGASELGGRAGELFGAACGGCLRSLTKRVLACVRVAVEMPFSSTLAAAAGATERLQGCTVARKIALLALSIFAHRGVKLVIYSKPKAKMQGGVQCEELPGTCARVPRGGARRALCATRA
jgi:hypothetical protein